MKKPKNIDLPKFIEFENMFGEFVKELNLKPLHRELIRTLIVVSKGRSIVEISYLDLAKRLYAVEILNEKKAKDRVSYAIKSLLNWQKEQKIELIRITRQGQRKMTDDGKFSYLKPRYRFVLLRELVNALNEDSETFEVAFRDLTAKNREKFKPGKEAKPYRPEHLLKKAKATVITKIRRIFELAVLAELFPEVECNRLLAEAKQIVADLSGEREKRVQSENFIRAFEEQYKV